jgi:hypothetical protein
MNDDFYDHLFCCVCESLILCRWYLFVPFFDLLYPPLLTINSILWNKSECIVLILHPCCRFEADILYRSLVPPLTFRRWPLYLQGAQASRAYTNTFRR